MTGYAAGDAAGHLTGGAIRPETLTGGSDGPLDAVRPGQRVRVTRQIPRASGTLVSHTEGIVLRVGQQKTGSWFAHARDKKLWLDRVELRLADGEVMVCNLDRHARVDILE